MADYCVGLTGGIASGKSAVARCFEILNVIVVDADVAARDAVAPSSTGLAEVVAAFGEQMLDENGALDRKAMRQRVFGDEVARKRLEAIIHPRVRETLVRECANAAGPYVIAAIPLLAEGGGRNAYPWLQRILVVDASVDAQRTRLMQRDGIDAALADKMIAAQATRAQRLVIADDILVNDSSLDDLQRHVEALHRQYERLAVMQVTQGWG